MSIAERTDSKQILEQLLAERVLLLDGAMGTMIQALRLSEADVRGSQFANHPRDVKNCADLLCLTQPAAIENIHRQYLEAGSDIVETNTFVANSVALADFELEAWV